MQGLEIGTLIIIYIKNSYVFSDGGKYGTFIIIEYLQKVRLHFGLVKQIN